MNIASNLYGRSVIRCDKNAPAGGRFQGGVIERPDNAFWDEMVQGWENYDANAAARAKELADTPRVQLTQAEIAELANKYDPNQMTQKEYDELIDYLLKKGTLRPEEILQIQYHGCIASGSPSGLSASEVADARFDSAFPLKNISFSSANGNVLNWVNRMAAMGVSGQPNTASYFASLHKHNAFETIGNILEQVQYARRYKTEQA